MAGLDGLDGFDAVEPDKSRESGSTLGYIERLEVPLESPGSTHIKNLLATRIYYLPYFIIHPCA
jgi:hypothetical protein